MQPEGRDAHQRRGANLLQEFAIPAHTRDASAVLQVRTPESIESNRHISRLDSPVLLSLSSPSAIQSDARDDLLATTMDPHETDPAQTPVLWWVALRACDAFYDRHGHDQASTADAGKWSPSHRHGSGPGRQDDVFFSPRALLIPAAFMSSPPTDPPPLSWDPGPARPCSCIRRTRTTTRQGETRDLLLSPVDNVERQVIIVVGIPQ